MSSLRRILVTGAGGQLGQELRDQAASHPGLQFHFVSKEMLDITQPFAIADLFAQSKFDYCINAAAYTAVDQAEQEREAAYAVNATAVAHLSEACIAHACRLVHVSTDYVFNGDSDTPYRETDATDPLNVYGASKLKGEEHATKAGAVIIRTSWVYSSYGKNFVRTMIRLMKEKQEISVVNDQFGGPTYAADLAEIILQIICQPEWKPGVYHYSNFGIISWYQFALTIKDLIGASCQVNPIPSSAYPTPAKRPRWSVLDHSKIMEEYKIVPKDWEASLKNCLTRLEVLGVR